MWPVLALLVSMILVFPALAFGAPTLLPRFDDVAVIEGLTEPVAVRFAAAGDIFVAEKSGRVKLFAPLPAPGDGVVVLDIRGQVMSYQDRGLLGLALHPSYPDVPYVYVLYTYDAPPGGTAPVWNDHCNNPTAPGAGCVVSGRLARYTMVSGPGGPRLVDERILLRDDWYQQYPSHSIGDLAFGPDGMLYVSGGDGASYQFADIGDDNQVNRSYPSAGDLPREGGALRSQDLVTGGDALGASGAILRIDPETGAAAPGNPIADVRPIAFGLRNPFRIGFRPGTRELWLGDVGEGAWEEIDRIGDVGDAAVENFGWPCYEGDGPHPGHQTQPLCVALIGGSLPPGTPGTRTPPFFRYAHSRAPGADLSPDGCRNGRSQAISGIAFYRGGGYPSQYQGALFFADFGVNCIYAMRPGTDGVPDPGQIDVVERAAEMPVALEVGPGGDIFYASIAGAIRRITYGAELVARASADTTSGTDPLTVHFDGTASFDSLGGALAYAWDLDGDGAFNDATGPRVEQSYPRGVYSVRLQVSGRGKTAVSPPIVIAVSERPVPTITTPAIGAPWKAGQRIDFAGAATDDQDGTLAPAQLRWRVVLLHCPLGGCHQHPFESFDGVAAGSFIAAPDGYPAYYDIEPTATDATGLTGKTTVRIDAIGTELTLETRPPGLPLLYGGAPIATPAQVMEVDGDSITVEAPSPQVQGGASYVFTGWSDGGDRAHVVTVPDAARTYVATYELDGDGDGIADSRDACPDDPDAACDGRGGCSAGGAGSGGALVLGLALSLAALPRRTRRRGA